jgi:hypothetical protein
MFKISLKKNQNRTDVNAYQVTVHDTLLDETHARFEASTNKSGDGLWIDGKQVEGACQFTFVGPHSYRSYFNASYNSDFE